jgi:gamma-glutamylcyclotransferase (GGCT)/AIG2-like uncharacterized protein YtfP
MNLFVYGTLQKGQPHHALIQGASFLGRATTIPDYMLVSSDEQPVLVLDGYSAVKGELYEVDEDLLAELDLFFEGYVRGSVRLQGGIHATTYVKVPGMLGDGFMIPSGDWRQHMSARF